MIVNKIIAVQYSQVFGSMPMSNNDVPSNDPPLMRYEQASGREDILFCGATPDLQEWSSWQSPLAFDGSADEMRLTIRITFSLFPQDGERLSPRSRFHKL